MFRNFWNSLKIIAASSVILSGSFFIPNDAAIAIDGFARTCRNTRLFRGGNFYLFAECLRKDGTYNSTSIDISQLIVNNNGELAWQRGGGFQGSCSDVFLRSLDYSYFLNARCTDARGVSRIVSIKVNERINNQNGVLAADF